MFGQRKMVLAGGMVMVAVVVAGFALMREGTVASLFAAFPAVEADDLRLAQLPEQIEAESATPEEASGEGSAAVLRALTPNCLLTLTSARAAKMEGALKTVVYTLTIKNTGQRTCKNASLSAYYSKTMQVLSVAPAATASNYYWRLGSLRSGALQTVTVQLAAETDAAAGLEACVTADNGRDACVAGAEAIPLVLTDVPTSSSPVAPVASTSSTTQTTVPGGSTVPTTPPDTTMVPVNDGREYGLWVWKSPQEMSAAYLDTLMASVRANQFTVLYVTVDDYLLIDSLPEGADKETKKKAYFSAIERLIVESKKNNVAVDALAGWKDWAQPAMKYKAFAIVDMVLAYNAARSANPFRSLQYDVEPYLLPTYETNKEPVLTEFVALIDETNTRLGNSSIRFAVTIPHFYDSAQAWTPTVTYKGVTAHTFTHLLRILDTRKDSSIILMSYRNFAAGSNGTIQISDVEVTEASAAGHVTKVIVGQEFGNVSPAYVTFYGKTRAEYEVELAKIRASFSPKSGFGGMAVHYFEPFSVLK